MNVGATFVADTQATILMQPTQRPFDDPPEYPQSAAVFGTALGQHRRDTASTQFLAMRFRMVSPITLNPLRPMTRSAGLPADRRDRIDQRQQLGHVVTIRGTDLGCQRNAVGVRDHMVFRAFFAAIGGVGAGVRPPKTARTDAESATARDQSILSASRNLANITRWSLSQTPSRPQSRRRRQQVIPLPQPSSCGRYSQGMPVWSTKRMPVRACRLPMGLRPGNRRRRGLAFGRWGSSSAHNESSSSTLAMIVPPCTPMTLTTVTVST